MRCSPSLVAVLTAAVASFAAVTIPSDPAKFHIFVMMGQSNMEGLGGIVEPCDTVSNPRIHKYWPLTNANGSWTTYGSAGDRACAREWVAARAPLNPNQWDPRAGVGGGGLNCGMEFGRAEYAADTSITVGLLSLAVSGSALLPWTKGGEYYAANLTAMRAAMALGTLKAILWHQGEAGTGCSPCDYSDMMTQMIADYRADLGVADMGFIACKLGLTGDSWGTNAELELVASAVTRAALVTSADFCLYDNVHYDAKSQRLMGVRMAQAWLAMSGSSAIVPLTITSTTYGGPRNKPYTSKLLADGGGTNALTWSIVSSTLPGGLSLSGNVISGTPTAAPGKYSFTAQASRGGAPVQKQLLFDVAAPVVFAKHRDTVYARFNDTTDYRLPVSNNGYEAIRYRWLPFPSWIDWGGPWDNDSVMHLRPKNTDTAVTLLLWAGAGSYNNNWDSLQLRIVPAAVVGAAPVAATLRLAQTEVPTVLYGLNGRRTGFALSGSERRAVGVCVTWSGSLRAAVLRLSP